MLHGDGLAPTTFVFRSIDERTKTGKKVDWKRSDEPRTATWLLRLVHRVCLDAEVRTVCPHGLRGAPCYECWRGGRATEHETCAR
jgi:hypothetical protein